MESFTNRTCELRFDVTDSSDPASAGPGDGSSSGTGSSGTGQGQGETVILLHGFPEDRHSWDAVTPPLTRAGFRVLAPDQRGYSPGARPKPRAAYTLPRLAGDVLALAEAAGAQRFHLAGHDWGAALAWYLAGRHPGRLRSLACLSVPHSGAFARSFATSSQAVRSWYMGAFQVPWLPERILARGGGRVMRQMLIRSGLDASSADRYAARAARPDAMTGPLNWYRALPLELGEPVPAITVPTLYIWGDRDRFVSRAAAERCGQYVTGAYRYEVLRGASHWMPQTAAGTVASLLTEHFTTAIAPQPKQPKALTPKPVFPNKSFAPAPVTSASPLAPGTQVS